MLSIPSKKAQLSPMATCLRLEKLDFTEHPAEREAHWEDIAEFGTIALGVFFNAYRLIRDGIPGWIGLDR
jgi:hypothetical protein